MTAQLGDSIPRRGGFSAERRALAIGSLLWAAVMLAYGARHAGSSPHPALSVFYNAPIAFLFLIHATNLFFRFAEWGLVRFLQREFVTLLLWAIGGAVLYLRLVTKTVEVSGHLAWLPMLSAQSWCSRFPRWVFALSVLALLSAVFLKFAIFRGPSGIPGSVAGILLAGGFLRFQRCSR